MQNYNIVFYEDMDGNCFVLDFIAQLNLKGDKQSKNLMKAIYHKLEILRLSGTRSGMPDFEYMHSKKYPIWQIRIKHSTGYYRIFICPYKNNTFVVLNYIHKDTDKTPPQQIKIAESLMEDYIRRII